MATNRVWDSQVARMRHSRILLDASFIIRIFEKPLKAFDRIEEALGKMEFVVLDDVLDELRGMAFSTPSRKQRTALRALEYAEKLCSVGRAQGQTVDEKIVHYAQNKGVAVATIDTNLRKTLRRAGVTVVTCRGEEVVVQGVMTIPKDS